MRIAHIAIWTEDIEKSKEFYCKYFGGTSNEKYINSKKGFESYFISFTSGAKLEIMTRVNVVESKNRIDEEFIGIAHFAVEVSSREEVNELTKTLRRDGYTVAGEPRLTGDGYYESVILDVDGNRIEIVG